MRDEIKCKYCGRPIDFVKTKNGASMPVDTAVLEFEPHAKGDALLINERGELVRCFVVKQSVVYDPLKIGFRPHFQTCPAAPKTREEKNSKGEPVRRPAAKQETPEEKAQSLADTFQRGYRFVFAMYNRRKEKEKLCDLRKAFCRWYDSAVCYVNSENTLETTKAHAEGMLAALEDLGLLQKGDAV